MTPTAIAVIPARGGSRRIPGKNIKEFCGRPMISYAIRSAREAGVFSGIYVLTDSRAIADVAETYGAVVPFLLPAEEAGDTGLARLLRYALPRMKAARHVCCMMATCPFIRTRDVVGARDLLQTRGTSSVFTVVRFGFPIFRALKLHPGGCVSMFWPENEFTLSQDLPTAYHDAAHFYWLDVEKFLRHGRTYAEDALPWFLPRRIVQDIDEPEDWEEAEFRFTYLQQKGRAT